MRARARVEVDRRSGHTTTLSMRSKDLSPGACFIRSLTCTFFDQPGCSLTDMTELWPLTIVYYYND